MGSVAASLTGYAAPVQGCARDRGREPHRRLRHPHHRCHGRVGSARAHVRARGSAHLAVRATESCRLMLIALRMSFPV